MRKTSLNFPTFPQRSRWWLALVCLSPLAASAASVIGPSYPSAGTLMPDNKLQPMGLDPVLPNGLTVKPEMDGTLPDTPPFMLKKIEISGNKAFETPVLQALVKDAEGQALTLKRLEAVIGRITELYHRSGYPVARAVVPAQEVVNGLLKVQVVEGIYGEIKVDNKGRTATDLLEATLAPLKSDKLISQPSMERAMLLLSDIPGVRPSAVLKPGKAPGSADLEVTVPAVAPVNGNVGVDTYGNPYTGRFRVGGTVNLVNPLKRGDLASLTVLSSGDSMTYGRLAYEALIDPTGLRGGVALNALRYTLGGSLASLGGHGLALGESLWLRKPLLRSQALSIWGQVQYDHKGLKDDIDSVLLKNDRALSNFSGSVLLTTRDALLAGGQTSVAVGGTYGKVSFGDASAGAADASGAASAGRFLKMSFNLARLQSVTPGNLVYVGINGQFGNKNLDPSEKMVLGGPTSVRAYDSGVLSADQGIGATLEYRAELGMIFKAQWQGLAFFDYAHATLNRKPWLTGQVNTASMAGAGIGISFATDSELRGRIMLAKRLGAVPLAIGTAPSMHAWAELSQGF